MIPSNARRTCVASHRTLICAAVILALGGCSTVRGVKRVLTQNDCNKPQPYQSAGSLAPLQVPVGIDPPDTRGTLRIPAYNEPVPPPRKLTDPCLDAPPPFSVTQPAAAPAATAVMKVAVKPAVKPAVKAAPAR